ncbi:MAG: PEP-CTERM sorting domain-containing protein [Planctomycetes bacterium]|nr:PEP-CTERM sorting domain-containing protein [Planctomycetota bacterium]
MKYAITMLLVCVGMFGAVAFSCGSAHAEPYTLEIVAQAGDIIDGRLITGFSSEVIRVGISDDREVAFFAYVAGPEGSGLSLMTQRRFIAGAGKVVDGWVPQFGSEPSLAINGLGDVAYKANIPPVDRGVFLNQNLLLMNGDEIDGQEISVLQDSPDINDTGTVVIKARPGPVKLSINGPSELMVEHGTMVDGFTVDAFIQPRINNAGEVVFSGALEELSLRRAVFSTDRVIFKPGDVIEDVTITQIDSHGINESGEVFVHTFGTDINGEVNRYIATENRIVYGPDHIVAGVTDPLLVGSSVVLNSDGRFAFLGVVEAPDGQGFLSFLAVSDAVLISEGDIFDDKVVRDVYRNFDMNEHGDIAFRVVFEDFSQAVVLATLNIPEPSSLVLAAMGACALLVRRQRRFRNWKGPQ